jgi:hypothetical protein
MLKGHSQENVKKSLQANKKSIKPKQLVKKIISDFICQTLKEKISGPRKNHNSCDTFRCNEILP